MKYFFLFLFFSYSTPIFPINPPSYINKNNLNLLFEKGPDSFESESITIGGNNPSRLMSFDGVRFFGRKIYTNANKQLVMNTYENKRIMPDVGGQNGALFDLTKQGILASLNGTNIPLSQSYDPYVIKFKGKKFVFFECTGTNLDPASICVAKVSKNPDAAKPEVKLTNIKILIQGIAGLIDDYGNLLVARMSASAPKALVYKDKVYVYWTVVQYIYNKFEGRWAFDHIYTLGRAINLKSKRVFRANEGRDVWRYERYSLRVADMFDITYTKDENGKPTFYAVGAVGKGLTPSDKAIDTCNPLPDQHFKKNTYVLAIAKSSHPLGRFGTNGKKEFEDIDKDLVHRYDNFDPYNLNDAENRPYALPSELGHRDPIIDTSKGPYASYATEYPTFTLLNNPNMGTNNEKRPPRFGLLVKYIGLGSNYVFFDLSKPKK